MKSSFADPMLLGGEYSETKTGDDYCVWLKNQWPSAFLPQLSVRPAVGMETLDPDQNEPALRLIHPTIQFNFMLRETRSPADNDQHCDGLFRACALYPTAGQTHGLTLILWNCPPPTWSDLFGPWHQFVKSETRRHDDIGDKGLFDGGLFGDVISGGASLDVALPSGGLFGAGIAPAGGTLALAGASGDIWDTGSSMLDVVPLACAPRHPAPVIFRAHNLPFDLYQPWFTAPGIHLTNLLFTMLGHHAQSLTVVQLNHVGAFSVDWALFNRVGLSLLSQKRRSDVYVRVQGVEPTPYLSMHSLYRACSADLAAARVWSNPGAFFSLVGLLSQREGLMVAGKNLWDWIQSLASPTIRGIAAEVSTWPACLQDCMQYVVVHLVGRSTPPVIDPFRYALLRVVINLPPGTLGALPATESAAGVWALYSGHFAHTYPPAETLPPAPCPFDALNHSARVSSEAVSRYSLLDLLRREAHHLAWYLSYKEGPGYCDPCYVDGEGAPLSLWGWPHERELCQYPRPSNGDFSFSDKVFWTESRLTGPP